VDCNRTTTLCAEQKYNVYQKLATRHTSGMIQQDSKNPLASQSFPQTIVAVTMAISEQLPPRNAPLLWSRLNNQVRRWHANHPP
jgi:hypothetical protein